MRRRLKSPLFPLFQVHVGRWILNTLQILCFSETIHHLYICRWNWIVVRGVSCLLGGDFVQTPPHTSIKTSRQERCTISTHRYADCLLKKFFDALKTVYGPQSSGTTPLLIADRTSLLTDKEAILKRWAEHFDGVLNRPSSINDEAINRLPQVECNPLIDELPTASETVKAINSCHLARLQDQMQYMQRSTKQEVHQLQRNWQSYFTLCGEKKPSFKNSRMQQLSTYSKGKGIHKSVTIIEASLYCQLLGRFLLGSYWIDWMNTGNDQAWC